MSFEGMLPRPVLQLNKRSQTFLSILSLALILWVTRYWHSSKFGLYEDDITLIPNAIQMSFDGLMRFIFTYITHLYGHGRPFSDSFIHLFSWLGWHLAGLEMIYVIGYMIVLGNAVTYYLLVRRLHGQILGLIAGVFFVLYSADTTQAYLTHSLGLFPSMLFLLLAFHAYLSRRHLLSYLLIALALLTYESTYFIFLVAPLTTSTCWGKDKTSELVRHGVIVITIFLFVFLLRSRIGDDRIADIQGWALILTPIRHMLIGPLVSLSSYLLRSYQALRALNPGQLIWVLPAFLSGLVFLQRAQINRAVRPVKVDSHPIQASGTLAKQLRIKWNNVPSETRQLIGLSVIAILMVVLAYPITFTTRSFSISGRATRVHFAAAPGVALFWGILVYTGLKTRRRSIARLCTASLFALILPLMFAFGFQIQADYKLAWERQQEFWEEILPLIASARDGTAILVAPSVFHDVEQIDANTWNLPRVLPQLYNFPEDWTTPPMVYRLVPGWDKNIFNDEGIFNLFNLTVTAPPSTYRVVNPASTIFIGEEEGSMKRKTEITIEGESYTLLEGTNGALGQFEGAVLFRLLGLSITPPE